MSNPTTLIEAAKILGVSTQTVRRLIQRKLLCAKQSLGPHGLRWEIERAELLRYLEANKAQQDPNNPYQQPPQPQHKAEGVGDVSGHVEIGLGGVNTPDVDHGQREPLQPEQPPQNYGGVSQAQNLQETRFSRSVGVHAQPVDHGQREPLQPQQAVPLSAHLAALSLVDKLQEQLGEARRQAEQAERTKMTLEWQMRQYQTALTDQAESLAEAQAMRKVAEARLENATSPVHEEAASSAIEGLKTAGPQRKGWGHRLRGWLGISKTG